MSLNGRACAAAALAVCVSCGGSLLPPSTQPAPPDRASPAPAAAGVVVPPPVPPAATAALSGLVVNADDRRPLSRARVTLRSPALSEPRVAITGADGTYTFRHLPAGAYSIFVTRTGFAPRQFGERRTAPPATVPLAMGQQVDGIDVALPPAGVIVGQILDEDNQPFAGARVDALVSRAQDTRTMLVSVASAESDDRGNFRLAGLGAGQYYVSAFDPALASVGDETGALTYTATYYPGTLDVEQASRVPVVPGVEPALKVVFGLRIIRPSRVSGTLSSADTRPLTSGTVILSPVHGAGLPAVATPDVTIRPDGTFAFRNVPPGRYEIRARGATDARRTTLVAAFAIAVEGRDVTGLRMTLRPGASINGTLVVDAVSTPRPASYAGIRIRAPSADGGSFGDSLAGDVGPDAAFRIRGVMAGSHYVTVEGLQHPWVLKSVVYRGRDVTDIALDVESRQELNDVKVVITDAATDVSGAVRDGGGREASDAMVMIVPVSQQFWTRASRRFRLLRTDAGGRYRVRGLPAGQYRVLATYDLDEREAYRRDLVQDVVALAVPLGLEERARRTVDLRLVSLDARRSGSR
jgi:Carboxypeptidase regulatory-like domain